MAMEVEIKERAPQFKHLPSFVHLLHIENLSTFETCFCKVANQHNPKVITDGIGESFFVLIIGTVFKRVGISRNSCHLLKAIFRR